MIKKCKFCSKQFSVKKYITQTRYCSKCRKFSIQKIWRKTNPIRYKEIWSKYRRNHREICIKRTVDSNRSHRQKYRQLVFEHYGNRCSCCNESEKMFLTIDHMEGGGSKHRKACNNLSGGVAGWIVKNKFPKNFQILCMNCNLGKHKNGGVCPHQS